MFQVDGLCAVTCVLWITVYYVCVCLHLVCWYVRTYVCSCYYNLNKNNKVELLLTAVTVVTSPIAELRLCSRWMDYVLLHACCGRYVGLCTGLLLTPVW